VLASGVLGPGGQPPRSTGVTRGPGVGVAPSYPGRAQVVPVGRYAGTFREPVDRSAPGWTAVRSPESRSSMPLENLARYGRLEPDFRGQVWTDTVQVEPEFVIRRVSQDEASPTRREF
jgi:hypothetical protein